MVSSLKADKEAFVSGLSGTTVLEISLVTVTLSTGYLLRCVAILCIPAIQHFRKSSPLFSFVLEYVTLALPGVLLFTVLADNALYILVAMLSVTLLVLCFALGQKTQKLSQILDGVSKYPYPKRLPFITLFRSYVNIFSAIAILAVDFVIFPRRFAKAETYGSGLMDIGVGCFIMAHGLTAPEARDASQRERPSLGGYCAALLRTGRYIVPLVLVGGVRVLAVKSTDYQEHVSEYGVHWNFFFTIAAVRLLCTVLRPVFDMAPGGHLYGGLSVVVALGYQYFLSVCGGRELITMGPNGDGSRSTLFSANREGVISCIGYLVIYMGSIEIGQWLFQQRRHLGSYVKVLIVLTLLDCALWVATVYCDTHVDHISRRFVNLPYILWIFSYSLLMLAIFLAVDLVVISLSHLLLAPLPSLYTEARALSTTSTQRRETPKRVDDVCFISAVDYNQLAFFLLANVLTGFVNFSMDTLAASVAVGLAVVVLYMLVLAAVFVSLHSHRIKIKI